jgi:hypothetical protein
MAKKIAKTHEVSALRVPGFSAEASLYTSLAIYRSSGGAGGPLGAVQPSIFQIQRRGCYRCSDGICYEAPCLRVVEIPFG